MGCDCVLGSAEKGADGSGRRAFSLLREALQSDGNRFHSRRNPCILDELRHVRRTWVKSDNSVEFDQEEFAMARIGNLAAAVGLFGGAAGGVLGERCAEAAFTGYTVVATPITNSGQNLVRYEVFANFDGATDTVLNVFNFQAQGGWGAHLDAASGFWHKDNSDYNGGVLGQEYGTWAPQLIGSSTINRPFDSFLLIGGTANATNCTNADPSWGLAGTGGWNQAQIPTTDLSNANAIGWFKSSPSCSHGRVGIPPDTATTVKLGQFILSQNDTAFRTYTLRTAYNNGAGGGVVFADGSFSLGFCTPHVWSRDLDGDGFGSAADGTLTQCGQPAGYVLNNTDNCPSIANPGQEDCDGDGIGNACDGGGLADCNSNG
ncbi:MAG: hypothetical protein RL591_2340, partial [Planctomycetota bacterium]